MRIDEFSFITGAFVSGMVYVAIWFLFKIQGARPAPPQKRRATDKEECSWRKIV